MSAAKILYKNIEAGLLTQYDDGTFTFQYHATWVEDPMRPTISLGLPKRHNPYESAFLHPFVYNMLPEGSNKQVILLKEKYGNNSLSSPKKLVLQEKYSIKLWKRLKQLLKT